MSECEGKLNAELLELPEKCAACPELIGFAKLYYDLGHLTFHLSEAGEDLVGDRGTEFDEMVAEQFPQELATLIATTARKTLGETLNDLDANKQQVKEDAEGLSRSCDGVLKMKAAKNGLEYIVAVCTSARAYVRDADQPKEATTSVWVRTQK